ncbi:MAG: Hemerythrin [Proteobacteria bacterium]|nr:Hemerythrin [Pseudomonadota bacterium]
MLELNHWKSSYSVGHWVLDNQHRVLLSLCADALDLMPEDLSEKPGHRFHHAQEELLSCIEEHFKTEERLLKQLGGSVYEHHRLEHQGFSRQLSNYLDQVDKGEIDRDSLQTFFVEWWTGHILNSDRAFSNAIQRIPKMTT